MKNKIWLTVAFIALFMIGSTLVTKEPKSEAKSYQNKIDLNSLQKSLKKEEFKTKEKITKSLESIENKDKIQNQKISNLIKENKILKEEVNKLNEIVIESDTTIKKIKKKGLIKRLLNL